jgi:hypothetical protein
MTCCAPNLPRHRANTHSALAGPPARVGAELVIHVRQLGAFAYQPIEQIATSQVKLVW